VWVRTEGLQIQGWDFGTLGASPIPLSDMPPKPNRPHVNLLNKPNRLNRPDLNSFRVVSPYPIPIGGTAWARSLPRIENTVTGEEVYRLPNRHGELTAADWDGRYLATGNKSGEVLILDLEYVTLSKLVV